MVLAVGREAARKIRDFIPQEPRDVFHTPNTTGRGPGDAGWVLILGC